MLRGPPEETLRASDLEPGHLVVLARIHVTRLLCGAERGEQCKAGVEWDELVGTGLRSAERECRVPRADARPVLAAAGPAV
jgi:hypothetical protein